MIGSALSLDLLLVAKYWLFALADKPVVWSRPMPCSLSEYPPPFTTRWKNAMNTRYGATSWSFSPLAEISPVAADSRGMAAPVPIVYGDRAQDLRFKRKAPKSHRRPAPEFIHGYRHGI